MQDVTANTLILQCINNDKEAWSEFTRRYTRLVWWTINRSAAGVDEEIKKDLFQEIFRTLLDKNRLAQIKNRNRITSWLVIVAVNVIRNYLKNGRFFKRVSLEDTIASASPDTAKELNNNEIRAVFNEALSRLPRRDRAILLLYFIHHRKYNDIAKILRISANTIASIIRRRRKILQKSMQEFHQN